MLFLARYALCLSLLAYFISRVHFSIKKLGDDRIASIVLGKDSKNIMYPSLTFCPESFTPRIGSTNLTEDYENRHTLDQVLGYSC
jgi:hypothetical protein